MALFPTQHMLTQGSLHYRLATLAIKSATPTALKRAFHNTINTKMHQYFNVYIYYDECSHHATP